MLLYVYVVLCYVKVCVFDVLHYVKAFISLCYAVFCGSIR